MEKEKNCPCGSGKQYKDCCKIAHDDINNVMTAEQLMRSRYSAYVLADGEYLHKSHHSKTRPKSRGERRETVKWTKSVEWKGLEIINKQQGLEGEDFGVVEFKAYFVESGRPSVIHEKSTFEKENGHWVYKDAL
ncbi:YchJ family protein [Flammeovirga sp. OC4]|uniref:YchJ family protein n=1 Tax=Flammeovirga sp. OC4 TaxID=1382345 RepID=UPI0005C494F1|nr:YchJ family metal-binding protein [Flammeovirga sp. OC4]